MSSHTNFKLFLLIFGYRSTSGPSVAIDPQWTFSGYRSTSGSSMAIGSPVDLQWL